MEKPSLVILAAGIGSRYGGMKQIDPVGANGELIIDYSIYDAVKAGFKKVVVVITRAIEDVFMEVIGNRISKYAETDYAYQELSDLPPGYALPEGRVKPWGTTQALLAAKSVVDGPFAAINADDFYGESAYKTLYDWLVVPRSEDDKRHFAMVGYRIENTTSENGFVTRGVCEARGGYLASIAERSRIEKYGDGARCSDDDGKTWREIPAGTLVSMNFWGFSKGFFRAAEDDFPIFLDENLPKNPLKCEYLLPNEVGKQMGDGRADVRVLESPDAWHGVTYREDRPGVIAAIGELHGKGVYPTPLWQ
ncbi:MAG: NTP transferase domain-containing protein [Synergistaceae bacterium]|jgi:hypothetical protein|nr:NTP transferase domain-containing protein [Synergistaceae bacterium]